MLSEKTLLTVLGQSSCRNIKSTKFLEKIVKYFDFLNVDTNSLNSKVKLKFLVKNCQKWYGLSDHGTPKLNVAQERKDEIN